MPKPYQVQDSYFHRAKEENYRARSAYKLLEIQEKYHVIRRGDQVLDLGSTPGSWLQVCSSIVGPKGFVLGVDLEPIEPLPHVHIIQGDVFADSTLREIQSIHPNSFDVVLSDMAPKTSGIKDADQYHSIELNERVLALCASVLKKGGTCVMKVFIGADYQAFLQMVKMQFETVKNIKPKASRDRSVESYIVGREFVGCSPNA